ncbi:MAG: LPS export ABC transporter permease LptG, partial [Gammaproteobacteria bacterium]|nr:LPS export ABC transporter permease LptG [Gammaproteobacteria bacterium]
MKLLTKYLSREIYFSVALVFAALLMLFALLDLISQLNEMGRGDYSLGYMLLYVVLILPGHVYELFPVAVLIGTIFALVQMAANSELTVYRASGVSLKQLIFALLRIGAPLLVLCLLFGEVVAPYSEQLAQQTKLKAQKAQVNLREFRSGVWVKDEGSFVNIRNVLPDTSLLNVSIYQFDENYRLVSVTAAKRATFLKERLWRLEDIQRTNFAGQGASAESLPDMEWHTALNPNLLNVLLVLP